MKMRIIKTVHTFQNFDTKINLSFTCIFHELFKILLYIHKGRGLKGSEFYLREKGQVQNDTD